MKFVDCKIFSENSLRDVVKLRCDSRFQHAFSKKLPWLTQTKVITLKTQLHALNAR